MGYYAYSRDCSFFLSHEVNQAATRHAKEKLLTELEVKGRGRRYANGKCIEKWYSWVNTHDIQNAENVESLIMAFGWNYFLDDDGNITDVWKDGGQKLGQEDCLFAALAPFIKDESYIIMQGEDDLIWRWYFENGEMIEQVGKIIFN